MPRAPHVLVLAFFFLASVLHGQIQVDHNRRDGDWLYVNRYVAFAVSGTGPHRFAWNGFEITGNTNSKMNVCMAGWTGLTSGSGPRNLIFSSYAPPLTITEAGNPANTKSFDLAQGVPTSGMVNWALAENQYNYIEYVHPDPILIVLDRGTGDIYRYYPPDQDGDQDHIPDWEDPDDDNDGVPDINDPDSPDWQPPDSDGDGDSDDIDSDDDNDGIPDNIDPHPTVPDAVPGPDTDHDGTPDVNDNDDDNDGVLDYDDENPLIPRVVPEPNNPGADSDGDGQPDSSDPDDDNDGTADIFDPDPKNPNVGSGGGGSGGGGSGGGGGTKPGTGLPGDGNTPGDVNGTFSETGWHDSGTDSTITGGAGVSDVRNQAVSSLANFQLLHSGTIPKATGYHFNANFGRFGSKDIYIDFTKMPFPAIRSGIVIVLTLVVGNAFLKRATI